MFNNEAFQVGKLGCFSTIRYQSSSKNTIGNNVGTVLNKHTEMVL